MPCDAAAAHLCLRRLPTHTFHTFLSGGGRGSCYQAWAHVQPLASLP